MANEKRLIKVIDATAVYNGIALYMAENAYLNDTALDVLKMVAGWLNEAPTVDAVEVVHGEWINDVVAGFSPFDDSLPIWIDVMQCSVCKEYIDGSHPKNYCPNCGAKMDGDGNG